MWDFSIGKTLGLMARTFPFIIFRMLVYFGITAAIVGDGDHTQFLFITSATAPSGITQSVFSVGTSSFTLTYDVTAPTAAITRNGTTVLIVEQDVNQSMRVADRVQCLLEGRTVLEGAPADLTRDQIASAYFGI